LQARFAVVPVGVWPKPLALAHDNG